MRRLVRTLTVVAIASAVAAGGALGAQAGVSGRWLAPGPGRKLVLTLQGSGKALHGTWVQGGKSSKVTARVSTADGIQQVTLTFTPGGRSSLCGLRGTKLYCQTATGTATFTRG